MGRRSGDRILSGALSLSFDLLAPEPEIASARLGERYLSDLNGYFVDEDAYIQKLAENPLVYRVWSWEAGSGEGDLICGFGIVQPGKVGNEFFFTKGHYHEWREAAEIYVGLSGEGYLLLEHEKGGESNVAPLAANRIVYVPGYTAHRTINTGNAPLTYLGIYSTRAGHDYGALAEKQFLSVLVDRDGKPTLLDRSAYRTQKTQKGDYQRSELGE